MFSYLNYMRELGKPITAFHKSKVCQAFSLVATQNMCNDAENSFDDILTLFPDIDETWVSMGDPKVMHYVCWLS